MTTQAIVYTVVHQPRRLKLPAQPIPYGASVADIIRCVFDEPMNERYFRQVAAKSYYPATERFLRLVNETDFKLAIGFSVSFLRQAEQWDPILLGRFKELVAHPNVELVGVEPYHNFIFLLDMPEFVQRMRGMREEMGRIFGKEPTITDTTEMCMSASIYDGLEKAGFTGALLDGREWVMDWREPTHLYHYDGQLRLFTRHLKLSDDVGYRFSNRGWNSYPLYADTYAEWIRATMGEFAFLAWDFETFGEHHWADTGIFDFLSALPAECERRGVRFLLPSEAIAQHREGAAHLPLPVFPTTWAGSGGMEFFMGNAAQQAIFQLMTHCHSVAQLSGKADLMDLAQWLLQSDNLHLIQWFGTRGGSEAEVSAYFTPREWWGMGPDNIIVEQQRVYQNVLRAMEYHLPARRGGYKPPRKRAPKPTQELVTLGIEQRY
jgi:alpha-amylase